MMADSHLRGAQTARWQAMSLKLIGLICCIGLSGCVNLSEEEGQLPAAMRQSIATLTAAGYPDLTKIPEAPKDFASDSAWASVEAGLVRQRDAMAASPLAKAPTPEENNIDWAHTERANLENDPRSAPVPAASPDSSNDIEWAKRAKAKLEADLARLPPP